VLRFGSELIAAGLALQVGGVAMADGPFFEKARLETGLSGNCEIPTLGTAAGDLVYCVYSNNVSSIWVQWTRDAGRTWSAPVKVMGLPEPRYITDPTILVDGRRLTVFATHVLDEPGHERDIARSVIRVAVSEDAGATWADAGTLPLARRYVCGMVHAPVWLDRSTVVMGYAWDVPAEEGKPAADEGGMYLKCGVLISHDSGRTWTPGSDVEVPRHPIGADEPAIVRLSGGDLYMVVRTSDTRPYETVSHDGGQTWAPPKPSAFHGHNSPSALLRLRDGAIVRAWDNSPASRFPLVVSLSTNDCRTWTPPRTVAEPSVGPEGALSFKTACYPSLAEAADGTILLAWWQVGADDRFSVWTARFNRAWVDETRSWPQPVRIVAFGDSVTGGVRPGVAEAQTFRHLLQQRLSTPARPVEVINAGVGGADTATALARLERDVVSERPTVAIVMFGINDAAMVDGGPVARAEPRVRLGAYVANLRTIVERLQGAGIRVVLCTPTPMSRRYLYQDVGAYAQHEDINYMLRRYAAAARDVAREYGVALVDLFALFTSRADGLDLIEDGNHPFAQGHLVIAEALEGPVRECLR
jgi:lysophospholipase L1-like esterase